LDRMLAAARSGRRQRSSAAELEGAADDGVAAVVPALGDLGAG
jgi:hypothetical protein